MCKQCSQLSDAVRRGCSQLAEQVGLNPRVLALVRLILSLLFLTHLLGCAWRVLAGEDVGSGSNTWLGDYNVQTSPGPEGDGTPLGADDGWLPKLVDEYVQCLLLSLSMLLVVGYQVHVHVHVCACMRACTCMWRTEV